jgi:hypothetical protein
MNMQFWNKDNMIGCAKRRKKGISQNLLTAALKAWEEVRIDSIWSETSAGVVPHHPIGSHDSFGPKPQSNLSNIVQ